MKKNKRDKYTRKIRLAIIITVLTITPTALVLGIYIKNKLPEEPQKTITTEDVIHQN